MKVHPYICGMRKCDLCLREKLLIARANSASLLNKRDELISKCRHINKFTMMIMMMDCSCAMVDQQKACSLFCRWDHCQRSTPF